MFIETNLNGLILTNKKIRTKNKALKC